MTEAIQTHLKDDPALFRRWTMVRAKLEAAKGHLELAGSVLERRRPGRPSVWVVRFRDRENGEQRCRSVYLGEEAIAEHARVLIGRWRREKAAREEKRHQDTMRHLDMSAEALGFSGRARKRLRAVAEKAVEDPLAMARIVFGHPDPAVQFGHRAGRPSKSGLW